MRRTKRVLVKAGTGYIFGNIEINKQVKGLYLKKDQMDGLVEEICKINKEYEVLLVSSGATAMGVVEEKLVEIPEDPEMKRQLAGIGQPALMGEYRRRFKNHKLNPAQCLITYGNITDEEERQELKILQENYFRNGKVAIYNYNDIASNKEITLDNDNLVVELGILLDADLVTILSNSVKGLGRGGRKKKEEAISKLEKAGIPVEISNNKYERDYSEGYGTKYFPVIRNVLERYF